MNIEKTKEIPIIEKNQLNENQILFVNIFIQNFGELRMKLKSEKITNFTNNLDLNNRILKLKNKLLKERENNKIIYLSNSFKKKMENFL